MTAVRVNPEFSSKGKKYFYISLILYPYKMMGVH